MMMLSEFFPEFTEKLDEMDALYADKRSIDEKTYQFICFALSIKGRSKPCVLKHFKGALEAGVTVKELAYNLALVMREAAGADVAEGPEVGHRSAPPSSSTGTGELEMSTPDFTNATRSSAAFALEI